MVCDYCGKDKEPAKFHYPKAVKSKQCNTCAWKRTPHQKFVKKLKYQYNLTLEEYTVKFEKQRGRCACCRRKPEQATPKTPYLYIDHDHSCCPSERSCGACVRELLCMECNLVLGMVKEDFERLHDLERYLSQWPCKSTMLEV
jgi:hypothetical protein